ncbi:M16 family metallopeptidase [Belliella kenyensis]|uniref:M16 family metallopeptidase n=1 Tax=Belliella kenyensis TaxID=1472724 RepID=A0ABV8EPC8_9BACT|nr:insulinase family protein [Belliella kenyensis]MCH7402473.1 insulinase family protein [Belliella kenyensis]MDN3603272.1 insulinase family protein [Belliella kenyensis]
MKTKYTLILIGIWLISTLPSLAQNDVPLDSRVRTGKLANGLTYYVQQNPKPEKKVELRLAVNVGSILEEDDQAGLAHFTEHMAFNGTRNFEKNELISYLQSIGVSFGGDLNAYTGFDETVYILPIPSDDEEKLRSGFMVLADWAGGVLMEEDDIDGERGIIVEEWRTGQGYSQRIRDKFLPVLLHDSKYADRLPIGKMDIVENFEYETIRRFYKDWYRPDLMAVVAVGDEDPDKLEALIQEFFSGLENPKDSKERQSFTVPEHDETFVTIATDHESPGIQIQLYYKHKALPTKTVEDYKNILKRRLYSGMLSQRLDEIRQKSDAPFIYAGAGYGNFVRDLDYFSTSGAVAPGKASIAIKALIEENERVAQFGFTDQELERVKKSLMNSAERAAKEMNKAESGSLVGKYVSHFLEGSFAEDQQWRYEFYQEVMPQISLEEINALAKVLVRDDNRVIVITAPDKEKENLPREEEVLALFDAVEQMQLTPYEEKLLAEDLITDLPKAGKITSSENIASVDIQELTLSNGAKVFIKSTDFKNDEILINVIGKGGTSLYADEDHLTASNAGVMVNVMGIGDFSPTDLKKVMAGKTVSLTPNISTYSQSISGVTSPKDLETAMQLMHLYFSKPRKDAELYEVYKANQKTQLEGAQANPDFQFSKAINKILANGHPRASGIFDPEDYDQIDIDRGLEIYADRFSNAANFEFFFTGNIDLATFKPLIEQYIGSLPGNPDQKDEFVDLGIRRPRGKKERIEVGTDEKSQVIMFFSGETTYDRKKAADISYLGEILTIKLIENLREEIGGVYGAGASGSMSIQPVDNFSFSIQFPCSPDMVDKLTEAAWKEVRKIQENGPTEDDLNKVKEKRRIAYEENLKRNNFWNGQMSAIRTYGFEWESILDGKASIEAVTADRIQEAAIAFLTPENLLEIQRFPAK